MRPENKRILKAARAWRENADVSNIYKLRDAVDAAKPAACLSPAQRDTLTRVMEMLGGAFDYSVTPDTYARVNGARKLVREMLSEAEPAHGGNE